MTDRNRELVPDSWSLVRLALPKKGLKESWLVAKFWVFRIPSVALGRIRTNYTVTNSETRMTASVLKQEPKTSEVQNQAIY